MYEAWEASNPRRRVSLAKKALALSADCADAYVILATATAKTLDEAIDFTAMLRLDPDDNQGTPLIAATHSLPAITAAPRSRGRCG